MNNLTNNNFNNDQVQSHQYSTLSSSNFQLLKQLGTNRSSGRITYLAKNKNTGRTVVIKEFKFLDSWTGFQAIEQEAKILSGLHHPGIPEYLGWYKTENSICLIQEYINAPSLATYGKLPMKEIKEIALSILDILVYQQSLNPPIFHRDIKPENLLYNQQEKKAYLVDFGAAKDEIIMGESTRLEGTPGFSPPEQLQGKKLNLSSDLYSLGLTLICLLSGISSGEINQFIDYKFEVKLSKVNLDDLSWQFKDWLEKLLNPDPVSRFSSALEARQALDNIPSKKATIVISKKTNQITKKSRIKSIILCLISLFNLVLACSLFSYYLTLMITPFLAWWETLMCLLEGSVTFDSSLQTAWKTLEFLRFTPHYGDWLKDELYLYLDIVFGNSTSYPDPLLQFSSQLWNFVNQLCGLEMTQGIVFSFFTLGSILSIRSIVIFFLYES